MYKSQRIAVVMPAYNAAKTLGVVYAEVLEQEIADIVIIVDDGSNDETFEIAQALVRRAELSAENAEGRPSTRAVGRPQVLVHRHLKNTGYGGNQKTCYKLALEAGADIVIMVHPDCQYTPKLIPAMASLIANGLHACVLGSRILGGYALKGGMPIWKYVSNRVLTLLMNLLFGAKLSEYHTGYRAFSKELLQRLPLEENMDDFAFDAQMLAEILWTGATIAEVSCPTRYFRDASSINFSRSVKYGFGCLATAMTYRFCRWGLFHSRKFRQTPRNNFNEKRQVNK
jgi:glycosyltransferase involved in cell wall biosynthesis